MQGPLMNTQRAGAISGFWIGLFVGITFLIFSAKGQIGFLITTPLLGAVFGLIWRGIARGNARQVTSVIALQG
jgi:hypothetical protein